MMTPGTYVRLRREAVSLSLEDVATLLATDPHVPAQRRVDWLAAIEADREDVSERTALALIVVLPIDFATLSRLVAISSGARDVPAPRLCSHCGAGAIVGCIDAAGVRALRDVPAGVMAISRAAMLRHTGQADTIGGTIVATLIAREAGWQPSNAGDFRRPLPEPIWIGLDLASGADLVA